MIAYVFLFVCLCIVGGFVGWVVQGVMARRRRLSLAAVDTCLLCGSSDVELVDDVHYECRSCGFDSSRTQSIEAPLEQIRTVDHALFEFEQARTKLQTALGSAVMGPAVVRQAADEATAHQTAGMRHLQELVERHPELLELAFASDAAGRVKSRLGNVGRAIESGQLARAAARSRDEIDEYVATLRAIREVLCRRVLEEQRHTSDLESDPEEERTDSSRTSGEEDEASGFPVYNTTGPDEAQRQLDARRERREMAGCFAGALSDAGFPTGPSASVADVLREKEWLVEFDAHNLQVFDPGNHAGIIERIIRPAVDGEISLVDSWQEPRHGFDGLLLEGNVGDDDVLIWWDCQTPDHRPIELPLLDFVYAASTELVDRDDWQIEPLQFESFLTMPEAAFRILRGSPGLWNHLRDELDPWDGSFVDGSAHRRITEECGECRRFSTPEAVESHLFGWSRSA